MKLFQKKKESEFLSIKEINKKVKDLLPLKEDEAENEYNLAIILKSLIYILYNFSRQLNLGNDPKQELIIPSIEKYLEKFKSKPYYDIKISPIINFLKSHYLLSKQEKAFLTTIKDIKLGISKVRKLNDNQIDRINYILVKNFEKLINFDEIVEIFSNLFYMISEIKGKENNYLFDYYIVILLLIIHLLDFEKNNDNKNNIINVITTLFIIISGEENNDITELAFLLFCELYTKVDNNPFTFSDQSKWLLLILKLLKEEICLFNLDPENNNNVYNFIKPFHHKFFIGEIKRNKIRKSFFQDTFTTIDIFQIIKLPENSQEAKMYLNDKIYEKFPKELHLPKGPLNNVAKYLYDFNKDFTKKLNEKKKNIILGALQISSIILKTKYQESDFDFKYFAIKLSNEIIKRIIPLYKKNKHFMRICLYCMGSMMSICPHHLIKYIPYIFHVLAEVGQKDRYFINLNYALDYFLKKCNEIFMLAYNNNNFIIFNEINKINKSEIFFQDIYSLMVIIFHIPNLKIVKKSEKNTEVNFSSLLNNTFNFLSFLVNEYLSINNYLPFIVEANLVYLIVKYPTLYVRKYMTNIISKIYIEHVLISIYKNLFIDEFNNLKYKSLFFVIRLLLVEKMHNYLDFFTKFLQKNIIFEISSSSEILEYLVLHISFDNNKLYISNFQNEEDTYKINNGNNNLEVYSLTNQKFNISVLNYIIDLIFLSIKQSGNLDDIININKLVKMIFLNLIPIDEKNLEILLEFLMKYLNNINKLVEERGYQTKKNNFRKLVEILYYTNFYIIIKENNAEYFNTYLFKSISKDNKRIQTLNQQFLIRFYHFVIIGTFQLIPENFCSKEYDFQNIFPLLYLYIFIFCSLFERNNGQKEEIKSIITDITKFIIDSSKNNYNSNNNKQKYSINYQLAIFYIFSIIRNNESKYFLSFISFYLVQFLNIEEFKLDNNNSDINALNYILFNIFIQIMNTQEINSKNKIHKSNISSRLQNKSPFLHHIYSTIKNIFGDINNQNENKNINHNLIIINECDEKINFINENLKLNNKTNFIEFSFDGKDNKVNNNDNNNNNNDNNHKGSWIIIENKNKNKEEIISDKDSKENNSYNNNYQSWLNYLMKTSAIIKSKKNNYEEDINKYNDLLKSSFSFYKTKIEKNIGLIKSEEINNKDIPLFISFLSNLGIIMIKENRFIIQKEYLYDKNIINLDKNESNDILIVLIKDNFQQIEDSILNEKFIIYVKPLILKSVFSLKITKNSNNKNKYNINKIRINTQLDNDINKMFSDFIILDFNNKVHVDYFYKIIDVLFNYSLLESFIGVSMNLTNK